MTLPIAEIGTLLEVPLEKVCVNPFQPRRAFAKEELEELAQSIIAVGLLHPPLVRPIDNGFYEIISGERRFRACQLAGIKKIAVVMRDSTQFASAQAALIENVQRVDLNPLEIAKALERLQEEFSLSQEELSRKIGKKRSTIANYFRLLTLPKNIQESVRSGGITMGHAKAILGLEGWDKQNLLHEMILRDGLNVREAESAALKIAEKAKRQGLASVNRDFFLEHLEQKIQDRLGTKVTIQSRGKKGRISIHYYSLDDLDRVLECFGVQ